MKRLSIILIILVACTFVHAQSISDRLELVAWETGYYKSVDYNSDIILYQPQIILKFKNNSDSPIKEEVTITGIFISGEEEWSHESYYFQASFETPLQPKLSRQISVKSNVGWKSPYGINQKKITVRILINDVFYRTFNISPNIISYNRITTQASSNNNTSPNNTTSYKGVINDPDGYTNIRKSNNGKSEIIGKVMEGEVFTYWETNDNWYIVETAKGIKGFMYKNRIKPIEK